MTQQPSRTTGPRPHRRRPVRWWWPVLVAVLLGSTAAAFLPVVAFGTSYCPPDEPDPYDVLLLRGAFAVTGLAVAVPFVAAAAVDLHRGAPEAARAKALASLLIAGLAVLSAAGARPSTWCF